MRLQRQYAKYALLAVMLLSTACNGTPNPNYPDGKVPPHVVIVHYATQAEQGLADVQKAVTAAVVANPAAKPAGDKFTEINTKLLAAGRTLNSTARAYEAATTFDVRNLEEKKLQEQIAAIQKLLGDAFGVSFPGELGGSIGKLVANVAALVSQISFELAKARS